MRKDSGMSLAEISSIFSLTTWILDGIHKIKISSSCCVDYLK
jgi:hypothetical protein